MTTEEWNDKQTGSNDGRADLSSPLGAVAMRDAAANRCDGWAGDWDGEQLGDAIRAIPLPTHAALLAHAMRLPEVAAMVEALKWYDDPSSQGDVARATLAALEAKP